ncbi:MAG TPA: DUF1990 domain-containing protein [Pyrinomonadaceae bacterium]|nr:DUF1990 domain-containing protein [Pyrinomonadaceae bacterium]
MTQTNSLLYFRKPSEEIVRQFIAGQRNMPFSYSEVGATQSVAPPGYTVDHNRIKLGEGETPYRRAVSALQRWEHFDLGWVEIVPDGVPVEVGQIVAMRARTLGLWWLNACRIVYLLGESDEFISRFGFAYGTLPAHVERGEERFTIEWHKDNSVWYDIYAFSRPQHRLVKLGHPYARSLQKRFAKDSLAAMRAASQ